MRISYNHLKKMVDFPFTPEELALRLTEAGLEVKSIEKVGQLENVVVGKILSIKPHPNADRLKIVDVLIGDEVLSFVCGAPNVEEGKFVAVALEGAKLPGDVVVGKVKIRGVLSPGMICSERELGLGEDHSGIMVLPASFPPGEKLSKCLELEDYVLDLEITPNRGDCLSILGVAREVAAITGGKVNFPSCRIRKTSIQKDLPGISIKNPQLCSYYAARLIRDVKVAPSPLWLRWKITLSGGKPVNNVVDVTNYVMWEMGQPLHPFDLKTIAGPKVVVRTAGKGESIVTLDGKKRDLSEDMLVIADAESPIAIAGIMGGEATEVKQTTKDVLLEGAYFDSISVGKTSRKLGLKTEASLRFERGVDPLLVRKAIDRASFLIQEIAGGEVVDPLLEAGKIPVQGRKVFFRPERASRIVGVKIPASCCEDIFKRLGFGVKKDKKSWTVFVPPHRHDITTEIDLIEEVSRIYGYAKIGTTLPPAGVRGGRENREGKIGGLLKQSLQGCGFYEAITNPLVDENLLQVAGVPPDKAVILRNPLSIQQKFLRFYLFPRLLEVCSFNYNQLLEPIRIMEMGKVFSREKEKFKETLSLGGAIVEEGFDFYSLKGIVEAVFDQMGIEEVDFLPLSLSFLHPAEAAGIEKEGVFLGFFGKAASHVNHFYKIPLPIYFFELDVDAILQFWEEKKRYKPLPRFPSVKRDFSIVVREEIFAQEIKRHILKTTPFVEKIEFFDLYRGPNIPPGCKSISFSIFFRHPDRTLTDREVSEIQEKMLVYLKERFKASLRGAVSDL